MKKHLTKASITKMVKGLVILSLGVVIGAYWGYQQGVNHSANEHQLQLTMLENKLEQCLWNGKDLEKVRKNLLETQTELEMCEQYK